MADQLPDTSIVRILVLTDGPAPTGSGMVRLAVEPPRPGRLVRVFGYPATCVEFPKGGFASLFDNRYKLDGDPGNDLWWAIKLCRFAPGELDPYVPGLRRLPLDEPIPLAGRLGRR